MADEEFIDQLFLALSDLRAEMRVSGPIYEVIKELLVQYFRKSVFASEGKGQLRFGPFGQLHFPYRSMGAVDSIHLFGVDELLIFAFYWANRTLYRNTLDLGANIGLHSILMSKCGYNVTAFEPDPIHQKLFGENLSLNGVRNVCLKAGAASNTDGKAEFVRVLGNTTGSHLAGAKDSPYGEMARFDVKIYDIAPFVEAADFAKIDVEGHELFVLSAIKSKQWDAFDALLEVGTSAIAVGVIEYSRSFGLNVFAQKIGWEKVTSMTDMPISHKEGSILLTRRSAFPWG